ncbi:hypothetical protein Clacol_002236 [Clathrus columnatus]|uniref:G domain-containing protein n=1 Tax=Clathrus columnatus TaxID=1419009 RepID=A0AAV5A447_9AGAM|nr:hypothetical protein Clacol_002236 [Clathrus columnatus]
MSTNPSQLPSRVEQTLAECPQFRILITGNTGIGKSSLVSKIFNVDLNELDIAHDRAGRANIEHGFTSSTNPRFILHDSQGYEPGNLNQWGVAEAFIKARAKHEHPQERVHAIWLCIETPRTGGRLLQVGDENLIKLALKLELPLLVIFTKYDLLITEKFKEFDKDNTTKSHTQSYSEHLQIDVQPYPERLQIATKRADDDFQQRVKGLPKHPTIEYITVSTNEKIFKDCLGSFQNLTKVTRRMLHHVEGELWVPWATAQQVNASQKIETSISEGFKKYWLDLGTNVVFEGFLMWDCVSRIHRDILEIWNFNDPDGLLTGNEFCTQMVQLTQPILIKSDKKEKDEGQSGYFSDLSDAVTVAGHIATGFAQALGVAGIAVATIKFLYKRYQRIPITSLYLASYITSLIIILRSLFIQTLTQDPPRPLTKDLVTFTWQTYVDNDANRILNSVKEATRGGEIENPELKVAGIIREFFHIEPDSHSLNREANRPDIGPAKNTKRIILKPEKSVSQTSSTLTSSPEEMSFTQGGSKKKKKFSFASIFNKK